MNEEIVKDESLLQLMSTTSINCHLLTVHSKIRLFPLSSLSSLLIHLLNSPLGMRQCRIKNPSRSTLPQDILRIGLSLLRPRKVIQISNPLILIQLLVNRQLFIILSTLHSMLHRQLTRLTSPRHNPFHLFRSQLPHRGRGHAGPKLPRGHSHAAHDHTPRCNNSVGLHHASVEDLGRGANDNVVMNGSAIDYRGGADGDVVSDRRRGIILDFDEGAVANVGILANGDGRGVASDCRAVPDA
mmetsp:Transcript_33610/g.41165  ORF Transcript_33610/g.41165 Transcript_33610/m.41165 type:complete len:242 (-) Transcript_33610:323-1048(-)